MTEVEAAVVRRRLVAMRRLLRHLGTIGPISEQDLNDDLGLRLEVSMAVAKLVTLACEINAHVVRHETGVAPADLRSGFTAMVVAFWTFLAFFATGFVVAFGAASAATPGTVVGAGRHGVLRGRWEMTTSSNPG